MMTMSPRLNLPLRTHVITLVALSVIVLILLILITFSSPFSSAIYFLSADNTHFGAYGWCWVNQGNQADACEAWFGYESGNEIQRPFTSTLILWGIANAFMLIALIAVLPLLWGTWSGKRMQGTVSALAAGGGGAGRAIYRWSVLLTALLTCIAWILSIVGFCAARRAFIVNATTTPPYPPELGPALWIGLTAVILVLILASLGWPLDGLDPNQPYHDGNGYYHYRQTTREVTRPRSVGTAV